MEYFKDIERFVENKTVFCGIDVHREHWNLCFMCDGQVIEKIKMAVRFSQLLHHLNTKYKLAGRIRLVYEAGFSGFHLQRQLTASGYDCVITPPNRIPSYHDKVKTDKRDAQKLVQYFSGGLLKEVFIPPLSYESDRQILRLRHDYQKKLTRVKTQIKSFLFLRGIQKPDNLCSYWSKKYVTWLSGLEFEYTGFFMTLSSYLAEYKFYRLQLANLTRQLRSLSRRDAYNRQFQLLTTCPGIGLITAMTFLLELSDIVRFPSAEHFSSYLGLTPSQYSSGTHVRLGHITREGNSHVRRVLVESAWTVIRYDPFLRAKYDRIRSKGTNGKKAIVAVARSLAVRLRRCLLDEAAYLATSC